MKSNNYYKNNRNFKKHYNYSDMMMIQFTVSIIGIIVLIKVISFIENNESAIYMIISLSQFYLIYKLLNKNDKPVVKKEYIKPENKTKSALTSSSQKVIQFDPKDIVIPDIDKKVKAKKLYEVNKFTEEELEVLSEMFNS